MGEVLLLLVFAGGIGLIYWAARSGRTRISLRGEENASQESSDNASGSLLMTSFIDGSTSQHIASQMDTSHHGSSDTGSHHSAGFDCGAHVGFDVGAHH